MDENTEERTFLSIMHFSHSVEDIKTYYRIIFQDFLQRNPDTDTP